VGELTVRYLIYIPPLVNFFHSRMQQAPPHAFLFTDQGDLPWKTDVFTRCLQRHTTLTMGCAINSRQWCYIAIAFDRRIPQGIGCQLYGVSESWGQGALRAVSASDSDGNHASRLSRQSGPPLPALPYSRCAKRNI
jgi:hypothetical protein